MPLMTQPSVLAHDSVGQSRDDSLDFVVVDVVHASGEIGRICDDVADLIIRVVCGDKLATHGDCALVEIFDSPSAVEVIGVPLLDICRKYSRTNPLALSDAEVPIIIEMRL
jgi:hypothetical protein